MKIKKQLTDKLLSLKAPAIIAVSGFGGSGKSTFANLLGKELNVPIIGVDSFIKDNTLADFKNWEYMDFDRLESEILIPFITGKNPIQYGHFDWGKNEIAKTKLKVSHNGLIIIEGVGLFRPNLLKHFAYKIWIDCLLEEAIARGKKRDREEYNYPQDENWDGIWKKNDEDYFSAYKPKEMADFVVDNRDVQIKADENQQGKKMHANEVDTNASLVKRLLERQFPNWATLSIKRIESAGTNNALYKLGDAMVVRLPRIASAVKHIDKEYAWLPKLAPQLPFSVPIPLALGIPGDGFPWQWTIFNWLEGTNPDIERLVKPELLVKDIAAFIAAMRKIDPAGAPPARRGAPLETQDPQTRQALKDLKGMIDTEAATKVWEECLQIPSWNQSPVWVHGDLMPGNLLLSDNRLSGVIDFEGMGVGDPACDLIVAWNLLPAKVRSNCRYPRLKPWHLLSISISA